jgi:hypothetical protein
MFKKLRDKWGVSALDLFLILCTFTIGGKICGLTGAWLVHVLNIEHLAAKILLWIVLTTVLWPISVLLVSIPFGQFSFFKRYLAKMGRRIVSRKGDNARFPVAA